MKKYGNVRFDTRYRETMYSQNLFVLDFVRRFFVRCAQKISHKSKCRKDSEST